MRQEGRLAVRRTHSERTHRQADRVRKVGRQAGRDRHEGSQANSQTDTDRYTHTHESDTYEQSFRQIRFIAVSVYRNNEQKEKRDPLLTLACVELLITNYKIFETNKFRSYWTNIKLEKQNYVRLSNAFGITVTFIPIIPRLKCTSALQS